MTPQERFEVMLNFKGFGNPNGKYKVCFIGIEEAMGFENESVSIIDNEIFKKYSKDFSIESSGDYYSFVKQWNIDHKPKRFTKVYEIMANIISNLSTKYSVKDILDNHLFTEDGLAFQMNIYPLGRENNKDVNHDFNDTNRFGLSNINEYFKIVKEKRYFLLEEFWNSNKSNFAVTICFGKEYWSEFKSILKLDKKPDYTNNNIEFFSNESILLTPFFKFGNGCMNYNLLYEIQVIFSKHNISL